MCVCVRVLDVHFLQERCERETSLPLSTRPALTLVHNLFQASPSGWRINRGSLKPTAVDAQLFSILSNHMIRVSAPHPRCREGPANTQLTTILCGYLASLLCEYLSHLFTCITVDIPERLE